MRMELRETIS